MFYLFLRYLVLISLRSVWRQAGFVCHRDCLPRQGRCSSTFGIIFDYGRHCSLFAFFLLSPASTCARASSSVGVAVSRRAHLLGFAVACRARLLGPSARREGKFAALHASIAILWAITTVPDVVHSSVDDLVGDVARRVAAIASVQHLRPRLRAARRCFLRPRHLPPSLLARSIYVRLLIASSAALAVTLDLTELAVCCVDEILSRVARSLGWSSSQLGWPTSLPSSPPGRCATRSR